MKTSNLKSSSMSIVLLGVFFLFCPLTTSVFHLLKISLLS